MTPTTPVERFEDATWVRYCQKLASQFQGKRVTFTEYAHGITLGMISASDEQLKRCVDVIPADVLPQYTNFLESWLVPADFMPSPRPFLAGDYSDADAEAARARLRPKYLRLYRLAQDRLLLAQRTL
jgi:hypothetical protein